QVGRATEDHFLFGEDTFAYWAGELDRAARAADPVTVGALQAHIDGLTPAWGLRPEARDLVISAWALLRKRAWFEAGAAITPPALGRMRPNIELRAEELPDPAVWDDARANAAKLFGYTIARTYLTGANVAEFAGQVRARATETVNDLAQLIDELDRAHGRLGADPGPDDRLAVARALHSAAGRLQNTAGNVALITAMAGLSLPVALETAAQIRADATRDSRALRNFKWQLTEALAPATEQPGDGGDKARALARRLQESVAIPGRALSDELSAAENALVAWVVENKPAEPPTPPRPSGKKVLTSAEDIASLTAALKDAITDEHKTVHVHWWVQ
ncbi:MAG TPA: phage resistance protein, partial [Mycobacterium sp.]|nr:phage resistance protein [Mycobacterium sp.]